VTLDTGRRIDRNALALRQHATRAEHTSACAGITPDADRDCISGWIFGLLPADRRIKAFYLRHDAPPSIDTHRPARNWARANTTQSNERISPLKLGFLQLLQDERFQPFWQSSPM
jgi:hypothetical protein